MYYQARTSPQATYSYFHFVSEIHRTMHSHVCVFRKVPDGEGVLRWSLPKKDICFCDFNAAPMIFLTCPEKTQVQTENDLWFFNETREITNLKNSYLNQIREKGLLSALLNLTQPDYCGKILCDVIKSRKSVVICY